MGRHSYAAQEHSERAENRNSNGPFDNKTKPEVGIIKTEARTLKTSRPQQILSLRCQEKSLFLIL